MQVKIRLQVVQAAGSSVIGWVRCPSHVFMTSQACSFKIVVDPTPLPRSAGYFCEVCGFDESASVDVGPLFRVPVAVICPEVLLCLAVFPLPGGVILVR